MKVTLAQAKVFIKVLAERMPDLTRRDRGAYHGRAAIPLVTLSAPAASITSGTPVSLAHLRDRGTFMTAQRPDQEMHLLLQHEAARLRQRLIRVAGRIDG